MSFEGNSHCGGGHRIHVADVAVVQSEGKVCILALCLDCGKGFKAEFAVAKPMDTILSLYNTQKEKI